VGANPLFFLLTKLGCACLCLVVYACAWLCMAMHGYAWLCMAMHGCAWLCLPVLNALPYAQRACPYSSCLAVHACVASVCLSLSLFSCAHLGLAVHVCSRLCLPLLTCTCLCLPMFGYAQLF
jgi:hypothetical protein